MDESEIPNVVLAIDRANHKLCLPEFFVIWDMIMTGFTFTNFKNGSVTVEQYFNIFEFLGVNLLEFENEAFIWNIYGSQVNKPSLQITSVALAYVSQLQLCFGIEVPNNLTESVVRSSCYGIVAHLTEFQELSGTFVHRPKFELGRERSYSLLRGGFTDELADNLDDEFGILF